MFNLRVKTWEDWETLCKYWMVQIAVVGYRVSTGYQVYGRPGQKQHGVDIKPTLPGCGIVGQSKFIQGAFKLEDLRAELGKTDSYPGPITQYYLLTTAEKCTSIQNASTSQLITHKRQDGSTFKVHVFYWSDLHKLDFLPEEVKHNLFPEAIHQFRNSEKKRAHIASINPDGLLNKLEKLKTLLTNIFNEESIKWLETCNFRTYNISSRKYDIFRMAYLSWDRVVTPIRNNNQKLLSSNLDNKRKIEFYATWPVSETVFYALEEFIKIVYNNYSTGELDGNEDYLTIADLGNRYSIACQMESAANYLAQVIRQTFE